MIKLVEEKFKTRIDDFNKIKEELTKKINTIATIRLINFLLIIFIAYRYLKISSNLNLILLFWP